MKVMHLRDNLFLIGYASNELVIKNLDTGEIVDSIKIENDHEMFAEDPFRGQIRNDLDSVIVDFDVYRGNERYVLVAFRSEVCCFVDFKRRSIN